jgi:hypothetical protein
LFEVVGELRLVRTAARNDAPIVMSVAVAITALGIARGRDRRRLAIIVSEPPALV